MTGSRRCATNIPSAFPAFIASMPMNNVAAALGEIDRAIGTLGARGIQIFTNVLGKPLSAPQFRPIFQRDGARTICRCGSIRSAGRTFPTIAGERHPRTRSGSPSAGPTRRRAAVTRLIYSGIYDELPGLKIVTHHMGGMIPYFAGKIALGFSQIFFGATQRNPVAEQEGLKRSRSTITACSMPTPP